MAPRCIVATLALCAVTSAHASPRTDPTTGRAVFTGATMPHATSLGLAPAALGLGDFNQVYVAITGVLEQLHIDLAPFDDRFEDVSLTSPAARVRDVEASPGAMLAFIYHLPGDRGTLGFEARTNPAESFPSGQNALRYHTLGDGERDWLASVGASIKVTSELYFGASLSHQNTFLRLRYARDTALENGVGIGGLGGDCGAGGPCVLGDPRATEIYDVDVRSLALSTKNLRVNVGAVVQLARDTWLGVTYHTPPGFSVQTELDGHVAVTRAPRDLDASGAPTELQGQALVEIQFPASVDAELRARLSYQLDLHLGGRWEDLSRLQAYDVRTFGSTLPRNGIPEWTERPRGLRDSFAVWGGVERADAGEDWLWGARVGVETSSVPAARTSPLTIAPTSFTADLGAQWRISRVLTAQLSYGLQLFPAVSVNDSAFTPTDRLACIASGYDYATPACEAVREGYAISSAAGNYERITHALRIGLRYELP